MKKVLLLFILAITFTACVNDDDDFIYTEDLVGVWEWEGTCDETTDRCWHPNPNDFVTVEFTERYFIEIENRKIINELRYSIIDSYVSRGKVVYKISLQDGVRLNIIVNNKYLSLHSDGLVSDYRRISY